MDNNNNCYIELSNNPIKFDCISQLTSVFFDDSNKQVFAVRAGGATGIVVKGPNENDVISFCMENKGEIKSIKFSPDNKILAVQREKNSVEFVIFDNNNGSYNINGSIQHYVKGSLVHGFVWIHSQIVALFLSNGIEIFSVNVEKKNLKSIRSVTLNIKWFVWFFEGNLALLSSDSNTLIPVIIKQKTITKLPKLEVDESKEIPERDVILGQLYGILAVLILQQTYNHLLEIVIYLFNGPGLAPQKQHILKLGLSGRFAMNIVDNIIVVHHQTSSTSILFDIMLNGETGPNGITYHTPVAPGKTIKPVFLKIPTIPPEVKTTNVELYSINWVIFQPNIIIDAKLGFMWYISLQLSPLCNLMTDKTRLVEFLLQRTNAKEVLINLLKKLINEEYNETLLLIIKSIFDKINFVYEKSILKDLQKQSANQITKIESKFSIPFKTVITQQDMCNNVFSTISEKPYAEKILILYLQSLSENNIIAQEDLSKVIVNELIKKQHFQMLHTLIFTSLIQISKPIACLLLSQSNKMPTATQESLDMFQNLNANEVTIEILLSQGKVVDALRLLKTLSSNYKLCSKKYLEAAQRTKNDLIIHSISKFFQK